MRKLGIFIFIAGLYSAGWFGGAFYLENKLKTFQKVQQEKFREFSYTDVSIKGFPFRYAFYFNNFIFKGPVKNLGLEIGGDLNLQLQSEKCIIQAKLWNWRTFTVNSQGTTVIHLTREAHPGFTVSFEKIRGKIFLNHHGHVTQFVLETIHPSLGYFSGIRLAQAEKFTLSFRHAHTITETENIPMDKIDCRLDQLAMDQIVLDQVQLQCNILNPFSRGPLIRGLKIWRDDGGTIEVTQLGVRWKDNVLNIKGTISLDEALRPLAGMVITVSDYSKILEAFVAEKWLKPKQALTAQLALSLIKKPKSAMIDIPLTIQDGKMSVGPLLFFPIPSLEDMLKI